MNDELIDKLKMLIATESMKLDNALALKNALHNSFSAVQEEKQSKISNNEILFVISMCTEIFMLGISLEAFNIASNVITYENDKNKKESIYELRDVLLKSFTVNFSQALDDLIIHKTFKLQ